MPPGAQEPQIDSQKIFTPLLHCCKVLGLPGPAIIQDVETYYIEIMKQLDDQQDRSQANQLEELIERRAVELSATGEIHASLEAPIKYLRILKTQHKVVEIFNLLKKARITFKLTEDSDPESVFAGIKKAFFMDMSQEDVRVNIDLLVGVQVFCKNIKENDKQNIKDVLVNIIIWAIGQLNDMLKPEAWGGKKKVDDQMNKLQQLEGGQTDDEDTKQAIKTARSIITMEKLKDLRMFLSIFRKLRRTWESILEHCNQLTVDDVDTINALCVEARRVIKHFQAIVAEIRLQLVTSHLSVMGGCILQPLSDDEQKLMESYRKLKTATDDYINYVLDIEQDATTLAGKLRFLQLESQVTWHWLYRLEMDYLRGDLVAVVRQDLEVLMEESDQQCRMFTRQCGSVPNQIVLVQRVVNSSEQLHLAVAEPPLAQHYLGAPAAENSQLRSRSASALDPQVSPVVRQEKDKDSSQAHKTKRSASVFEQGSAIAEQPSATTKPMVNDSVTSTSASKPKNSQTKSSPDMAKETMGGKSGSPKGQQAKGERSSPASSRKGETTGQPRREEQSSQRTQQSQPISQECQRLKNLMIARLTAYTEHRSVSVTFFMKKNITFIKLGMAKATLRAIDGTRSVKDIGDIILQAIKRFREEPLLEKYQTGDYIDCLNDCKKLLPAYALAPLEPQPQSSGYDML